MSKETLIETLEAEIAMLESYYPDSIFDADAMGQIEAFQKAIEIVCQHADWHPISTAPKDGSPIDLWAQERERYEHSRITDCFFHQGRWVHTQTIFDEENELALSEVFNPTHWMPLPACPN